MKGPYIRCEYKLVEASGCRMSVVTVFSTSNFRHHAGSVFKIRD